MYTIKKGHQGIDVYQLQHYLNCLKTIYPALPYLVEDGYFGSKTEITITIFQTKTGLNIDGIIDSLTWDKLILKYKLYCLESDILSQPTLPLNPLAFNHQGLAIEKMQSYLNQCSHYVNSIPVDGIFEVMSQNKVIEFQKENNYIADGRIGLKTWNQIIKCI